MLNCTYFRYPPIKYKLPENLIFHKTIKLDGGEYEKFVMFSTKTGDKKGTALMKCFPTLIERDGKKNVPSLYVWFLKSSEHGFGTAMLNLARRYSQQVGCGGRFHLSADVGFMPNRIPHIFYRKFGMSTGDPGIDKKLDKFIARGKDATWNDFKTMPMYYPPMASQEQPKRTVFQKILHNFENILKFDW